MAFKAQWDGGKCGKCHNQILREESVQFNDDDQLEHKDCEPVVQPDEQAVVWKTTIHEREELRVGAELGDEEVRMVLPLQRPACPHCFLELPVSMVCGSC